MGRLEAFEKLKSHPMIGKDFKKLKKADIEECIRFIQEHDHLDKNEFAIQVNRWKLDEPKQKRHSYMWGIVLQSNHP